ncbi:hypothetical protein OROGR_022081 [Orobanche gracilis]
MKDQRTCIWSVVATAGQTYHLESHEPAHMDDYLKWASLFTVLVRFMIMLVADMGVKE